MNRKSSTKALMLLDASCYLYTLESKNETEENCDSYLQSITQNNSSMESIQCSKDNLIFDQSVVKNSIVTDYGLTCEDKFIKNIIGATYMVSGSKYICIDNNCHRCYRALTFGRPTTQT